MGWLGLGQVTISVSAGYTVSNGHLVATATNCSDANNKLI